MKMKLLFLASSGSIHSHKWIDFFVNAGHEICWISLTPETAPTHSKMTFHAIPASLNPLSLLLARRRIKTIIQLFEPDVMHIHSAGLYGLVGWLSGFPRKVLTVWGSDILLNKDKVLVGWLLRRILKNANLITTDAHHMADAIRAMGVRDVPIEIISFGIDTQKFLPQKISANVREHYNIVQATNVVSMRNFDIIYDIPTFIYAAKRIHDVRPNIRFYLGGRGPEKSNLEALVAELGLTDVVQFLGFIDNDQLPQLLSAMNIYVSTSPTDAGIAASTAEAMACGVHTIVSNVYDNAKWVIDGKTGHLFKAGDPDDLAQTILKALALSRADAAKLRKAARQLIIDKNDYDNEMSKMDQLLHRLHAEYVG